MVAVMVRFPVPGRAKTRLVPALGEEGAARLHHDLAAHCVSRLRPLMVAGEWTVEVDLDSGSIRDARRWLGTWPRYAMQPDGDLGVRLGAALNRALRKGAGCAFVVGSDCPDARPIHVRRALALLNESDVVIGPAEDGGYWLLGVRASAAERALPALFERIGWGGEHVLERTLECARAAGVTVALADTLADIDRPEDLPRWHAARDTEGSYPASVSVVVPALNEAERIGTAVDSSLQGGAREVIVVDGGSTDDTPGIAVRAGAHVVVTPAGRARQMNAGAAVATGDVLVFLHADTVLPPDFAALVCRALARGGSSGGAFSWGTDDGPLPAFFNAVGRARMAVFRVPYGDQALFLKRRVFEDMGGYPEQPIMEDWELAQRLRCLGRMRILPQRVLTSSRRWAEAGTVRASIAYLAIIAGYRLGIDPWVLERWRA